MYVLNRSAPAGITVRSKPQVLRGQAAVYSIDLETHRMERQGEAEILAAWLPSYVHFYGVHRVAIDGRPVPFKDEQLLRNVFLEGTVCRKIKLRAPATEKFRRTRTQ